MLIVSPQAPSLGQRRHGEGDPARVFKSCFAHRHEALAHGEVQSKDPEKTNSGLGIACATLVRNYRLT